MATDQEIDSLVDAFASSRSGPSGSGAGPKKEVTYADFEKMLDETPLFMRSTPEGMEDNEVLQGLRSLIFEGEGDEIAENFKNHGNELYLQKSYKEAIKAYTEGLDAAPEDFDLRISLLNNRAASNLFLRNYGTTLKDAGVIIALCTKEQKPVPIKALFRAGKALLALERWKEARDVVERGKALATDKDRKDWETLESDVERGWKRVVERAERIRREKLGAQALNAAIDARGLIVVNTPSPPDNPHPAAFEAPTEPELPLTDSSWTPPPVHTPLIFPTFLMYPTHAQSDFITHFHQETSLDDQLAQMFPPSSSSSSSSSGIPFAEWDTKRQYYTSNLVVYVETRHRRLLKVGKELTLREVLAKGVRPADKATGQPRDGIVLKDGLLSFIVLPKGEEEKKWIDEYKRQRDAK